MNRPCHAYKRQPPLWLLVSVLLLFLLLLFYLQKWNEQMKYTVGNYPSPNENFFVLLVRKESESKEEGQKALSFSWSHVYFYLFGCARSWASQVELSSVQFSCSSVSDSLQPHGLQHTRLPCPSPTPGACSNSFPSCRWCHPTISSSVFRFSPCLQSFPALGSSAMSQFFTSGGQRIGVSALAPILLMNIQDWFPLGGTCWISLQSKGLSRVFSNTTAQKH